MNWLSVLGRYSQKGGLFSFSHRIQVNLNAYFIVLTSRQLSISILTNLGMPQHYDLGIPWYFPDFLDTFFRNSFLFISFFSCFLLADFPNLFNLVEVVLKFTWFPGLVAILRMVIVCDLLRRILILFLIILKINFVPFLKSNKNFLFDFQFVKQPPLQVFLHSTSKGVDSVCAIIRQRMFFFRTNYRF